jgi:hypothetical protein
MHVCMNQYTCISYVSFEIHSNIAFPQLGVEAEQVGCVRVVPWLRIRMTGNFSIKREQLTQFLGCDGKQMVCRCLGCHDGASWYDEEDVIGKIAYVARVYSDC